MDKPIAEPEGFRPVYHRTLHALCEQLRRVASRVVAPVHRFDIPPQVMRGLLSVALVTRDRELHRCVLPYRDAAAIAAERRMLAKLLLWGELAQVEGRIEIGANSGSLLRYFLPDAARGDAQGRRQADRSHADWLAAAEHAGGPWQLWRVRAEGGAAVGGISVAGVHYLVQLQGGGDRRLEAARRRLGCRIVGDVPAGSPLARDVLGEWRE